MGGIRITGGRAGGRLIQRVPAKVRPTPAKLRRAFFEILGDIEDLAFVDLFAGAGTVGIEALSRGANPVIFVEKSAKNCKIIEGNLISAGMANYPWDIVCGDALVWLDVGTVEYGTIIFASPPYIDEYLPRVLHAVEDFVSIKGEGIIVVLQFPARRVPKEISPKPDRIHRVGDDVLIFWY